MTNVVPVRPAMPPQVSFGDMLRLAESIAKSGLFGMKTPDQALALMAIAQAEGRHPALAARDYSIIQGRPAKNSEAMLRDFLESGGRVEWHGLDDTVAEATFSHPQGGSVRIRWDMERAKTAGLQGKDNWRKYPRQMLRSRVVSEGVRTVCPMATSGMYVPEEVADFETRPEPKDITPLRPVPPPAPAPEPPSAPHDPQTGEILPPHALPGSLEDYNPVQWGGQFIVAVRTAKSQAEIDDWCAQNDGILKDIEANFTKAWRSINTAIAGQRAKLGPDEPDMIEQADAEHVLEQG